MSRSLAPLSLVAMMLATLAACGDSGESGGQGGQGGQGGDNTSSSTGSMSTGGGGQGGQGGASSGKWVSGYYVGYQQNLYPPSAIAWDGLTHLLIGRVTPNADGTLGTTFDIDPTSGPALAKSLTQLAHQHGKKAVVMLGGAGEHDGWVSAASSAHRAGFVQNLVNLAKEYGFDGFDLDWEPLPPEDQADFRALAEDLRAALPQTILTVPVGWVSTNAPDVEPFYGQIAPIFDQINIMSYSMAGAWPGWESWHSSAIFGATPTTPSSVDGSVKAYIAAGVPASKLGVGIGFYGSCWSSPVTKPQSPLGASQIVADDNVMSFTNIMTSYYDAASHHWDDTAKAPYLGYSSPHGPQGCTFVSYEDEQSILEKGKYAAQMGLGGAIVWTINQGHLPNAPEGQRDPLMKALAQGFLQ